jgi:hypothetical protein
VRGTTAEASRLPAVRLTGGRPTVGPATLKLARLGPLDREQVGIGATHLLWRCSPWLSAGSATLDWRRDGRGVGDRDAGPGGKIRIPAIVLVVRQGGGGEQRSFRREYGS